jgi:hypothetical protein
MLVVPVEEQTIKKAGWTGDAEERKVYMEEERAPS